MEDLWLAARLLLLLAVANTAPIGAKHLLGTRWNWPLDAGWLLWDGRPLLGPSKTLRGLVAAVVCTGLASMLLGFSPVLGGAFGAMAMAGDALSSFIKRRLNIPSSAKATGIDQIPEALLPLLAVHGALGLSLTQVVAITALFFVLEIPLARLFFRLGMRDRPY